jgi:hypothetical protein
MLVHVGQLAATVGSTAGLLIAATAAAQPWFTRREVRRQEAIKHGIEEIVTAAVADVKTDMIERVDKSDEATKEQIGEVKADIKAVQKKATETDLNLARQFGGNGGGIRQAQNEMSTAIANLAGRFDQHLTETNRKPE